MQASSLKQVLRNPSLSNPARAIAPQAALHIQAVSKAFPHLSVTLPLLQITDLATTHWKEISLLNCLKHKIRQSKPSMVSAWNCIRGNSGISGESGCGKYLSCSILQLIRPTGKVEFQGTNLTAVAAKPAAAWQQIQMVFQDPMPVSIP